MLDKLPKEVKIVEVSARDGLQNEPVTISVEDKLQFINMLELAGLKNIEVGAFVSPKWVPQMANTAELLTSLKKQEDISYPVLVPNRKGLDAAIKADVKEIAIFTAASEEFNQKNINCSITESIERFKPVIKTAIDNNILIRAYISCVIDCPYSGAIEASKVADIASTLLELGCYEISLGDTIGTATPLRVKNMLNTVINNIPVEKIAVHFHDTYGQALANILTAIEMEITTIDSAVAGLGGCPYAKGASGNVATEDVVYMLHAMGIKTGLDIEKLCHASKFICNKLNRQPTSKVALALNCQ